MDKKKIGLGVACAIISDVIFGFSYLFTKNITNSVSSVTLLSWRFVLAFVVMIVLISFKVIKVNFRGKSLKPLLLIAAFHPVIYFIGETVGINLTTASESGTIIACVPIVTLLCSTLVLKEKPSIFQVSGIIITSLGVIVIVLVKGLEPSFQPLGYLMLTIAVVSYSLYSVYAQKTDEFTSVEKTFVMIASGTIVFTTLAFVEHIRLGTVNEFISMPFTSGNFLITIVYLGVGSSVIAFLMANIAISQLGTNRTASFVGICTLVTVLSGVVILKEEFSGLQIIGTILVICGVYLANVQKKEVSDIQSTTLSQ